MDKLRNWAMFFRFGEFIDNFVSRPLSVILLILIGLIIIVSTVNIYYAVNEGMRHVIDIVPIINKTIYPHIREKVESNAQKKEIMDIMIQEVIVINVAVLIVLGILIAILK